LVEADPARLPLEEESFAVVAPGPRRLLTVAVRSFLDLFVDPGKAVLVLELVLAGGRLALEWCTVVSTRH
jgi:hypothetical protein